MERKDFLKNSLGFLGMALISPSLLRATEIVKEAACAVNNQETAGPFPTITPASLAVADIRGDRTGVPFTINIHVKNINNSCGAYQGALVDIWHCDKDGNYSEYGGTPMQATNYTTVHFLRGRQISDANGLVTFTSVFPGWYSGRATHIHVHIYTAGGTSLSITQIAFPEGTGSEVATVNASTANGYTKGMSGYTYNASDNVFSDGVSNEMSTLTGSLSAGYVLNWDAYVAGPGVATGISTVSAETQFQVKQNYPNPASGLTAFPLVLRESSAVSITLFDLQGRKVKTISADPVSSGEQEISMDLSDLTPGRYVYSVEINNSNGIFSQAKMLLKN